MGKLVHLHFHVTISFLANNLVFFINQCILLLNRNERPSV